MADALRDERGRLLPGSTANPHGRPPRAVETAMLDDIFKWFGTPEHRAALFTGWQRMIDRGNPKGIELALAYLAGKPRTDINLGGVGGGLAITVEYIDAGGTAPASLPAAVDMVAEAIAEAEAEAEDSEQ